MYYVCLWSASSLAASPTLISICLAIYCPQSTLILDAATSFEVNSSEENQYAFQKGASLLVIIKAAPPPQSFMIYALPVLSLLLQKLVIA